MAARILIVDDDAAMRTLLATIVERAGLEPVLASSGTEALEVARAAAPALVVLDVNVPELSGYEVCSELRRLFGNALPIMFLSGDRVESYDRVAGFLVGGDDYVVKPFSPGELVARIRRLLERVPPATSRVRVLTVREREVLQLLAEGLEQAEIAAQLVISTKTVASHIEHVLTKLGVRSRAQAVALAYREGLVSIPA